MTRKRSAGATPAPWRSIGSYGDPGETREHVVTPPVEYRDAEGRDRYGITMRGRLPVAPTYRLEVDRVTVTDRHSGATITIADGRSETLNRTEGMTPRDVARLVRDGRFLAGETKSALGRPFGTFSVEDPELSLRNGAAELRRRDGRVTQSALATQVGVDRSTISRWMTAAGLTLEDLTPT